MSNSNVVYEWTTRIHVKKHELGESFTVLIFLGDAPEDPEDWRTSPSFVGAHSVYVSSAERPQGDGADVVTEGFVHLNSAIAERSGLSSYEPSKVIPYLKESLNWRIQGFDRSAVEPADLPSLEVTVVSTPLTRPPGSIFPKPGEPQYHHGITYGRPGGAHHKQA